MKLKKRSTKGLTLMMTLGVILGYGLAAPITSRDATAAPKKNTQKMSKISTSKKSTRKLSPKSARVGEGLRRKKSHSFDGMTVDSLGGGRYDSITSLSEGGDRGGSRLYSLPANFSYRAADEKSEMRYRP